MLERWMGVRLFWFTATALGWYTAEGFPLPVRLAIGLTIALAAILGDYIEGRRREKYIENIIKMANEAEAEEVTDADPEEAREK